MGSVSIADAKADDFAAVEQEIIDVLSERSEAAAWAAAARRMAANTQAGYHDPVAALALAKRAAEAEPESVDFRLTLGIAQYRADLFAEAKQTLERVAVRGYQLIEDQGLLSSCLLALVNQRLENHFDARQWSEKAESLPQGPPSKDPASFARLIDE